MTGTFLQYTTKYFVYYVIAACCEHEGKSFFKSMKCCQSCQFRVICLFSRCISKTIGLWDRCGKMCAHDDSVDGWGKPTAHHVLNLPTSSLSQPPLHLAASSSDPCIYCMGEETTEVQHSLHLFRSLSSSLLPPTSPRPETPHL